MIRFTSPRIDEVPSTFQPIVASISAHSRAITRGGVIPLDGMQPLRGRIKELVVIPCYCTLWWSQTRTMPLSVSRHRKKRDHDPPRDFGETLDAFQQTHRRAVRRNLIVCSVIPIISKYHSVTFFLNVTDRKLWNRVQIAGYFRSEFYERYENEDANV